jgi:glyoxylase-like metal-dependent hydrolase (beta-lactamase superfamily II)
MPSAVRNAKSAGWSPVSGTNGIELYELINKPSLITSNAFLLRTPSEIVVIDPGASNEQRDRINHILADLLSENSRPILVMLTHCHHDHSCHAGNVGPVESLVKRVAHVITVEALRRHDRALTIADLYPDAKICDTHFDLVLFQSHKHAPSSTAVVELGRETKLALTRDAPTTGIGRRVDRQILRLGTGDELEFYHTPGHSPDHLCLRLGRHLFLGDLPFASNPGLAGLPGWDATALDRSIGSMCWLIEKANIETCHTGHGRSLPAAAMRAILERTLQESSPLADIAEINKSRVTILKTHSLELLDVARDLFAVIAGRLLSTAHRLELLDESAYAEQFRTGIDIDGVERALDDLQQFCANFRADVLPQLSTVLKCVQVMQLLEYALTAAGEIAGAALTARTARLLEDFFNAVRGLRITNMVETIDANELAEAVIRTLRLRPPLDDVTPSVGRNDEAFARSLARRLAFVDILRHVDVELIPLNTCTKTTADPQRLSDVLTDAVELIAASGARHIALRTLCNGNQLELEVQARGASPRVAIDERRQRVYQRVLAIGGSSLGGIDDLAITVRLGPIEPACRRALQ